MKATANTHAKRAKSYVALTGREVLTSGIHTRSCVAVTGLDLDRLHAWKARRDAPAAPWGPSPPAATSLRRTQTVGAVGATISPCQCSFLRRDYGEMARSVSIPYAAPG